MKLLFVGDLAGTGFGSVTRDLGIALLDIGHDVRFTSQNELGDLPEPFKSRTFMVNDPDGWWALVQNGGIGGLLDGTLWPDGWIPDAALLLGDYIGTRLLVATAAEAFRSIPTFHYMPVEGVSLPPRWKGLWDIVHPVAMTEFGAGEIEKVTGVRPPFVYHGVDTVQFSPVTKAHPLTIGKRKVTSKAECKALFMHTDSRPWKETVARAGNVKWLLRTDRLMPRKQYESMLRAVGPVLHENPDTTMVIHCRSVDEGGDLYDLFSKHPPHVAQRMVNTGFHDTGGGASRDILRALYNAADVYVSTSAEGFGLTIAEALACGTPVVGLDYSAVPEVIGPAGLLCPIGAYVDSEYGFPWARPHEQKFGGLVTRLLHDATLRASLG